MMYISRYLETSIITNPFVFDPDYLPEELPYRDGQLDAMAREVAFFVKRGTATNLFLFGPPGTGKTASLRKIMQEATTILGIRTIYVNAWRARTPYNLLSEIIRQLGLPVPTSGKSITDLMDILGSVGERLVVGVDEVDRLSNYDILYDLSRLGGNFMLITVANSRNFVAFLDRRIVSTLFQVEIEFPPYTVPQLVAILRKRAETGLRPGSYDETILRLCASVGFGLGGDARAAISCLFQAAKEADGAGRERITEEDVVAAKQKLKRHVDLDPQLEYIVEILMEGPKQIRDLYTAFSKRFSVSERTFRTYLRRLERLGLVEVKRLRVKGNVRVVYLKNSVGERPGRGDPAMLRPGFEPGSRARKARMLDRTTPPEPNKRLPTKG